MNICDAGIKPTTPLDLLAELRDAGVTVTPAIDFDGPTEALTDDTLELIHQHKSALLRLLVNPYRHTCIEHPERQKVCDLLADAYDRDPLWCMELAKAWYEARASAPVDSDRDAVAWATLLRVIQQPDPSSLPP